MASHDVFFVPLEILENSPGFSFDIGGTLAKIAYVPNSDQGDLKVPEGMGVVRLMSFPRNKADEIVDFISSNCRIKRPNPSDVLDIEVTGIGTNLVKKKLSEALNIRLHVLPEHILSLRAFLLMRQVYPETAFYPHDEESSKEARDITKNLKKFYSQILQMMGAVSLTQETSDIPQQDLHQTTDHDENVYPFMMVLVGSGCIMIKFLGPDKFEVLDIHTRAGRYFHGLGSLLTGCESFADLIDLAERGTNKPLDFFTEDHKPVDAAEDDMYSAIPSGIVGTSFGKACGKRIGDFKPEDLARTLLVTTCLDITQVVFHLARRFEVDRVYFGGTLIDSKLIRQELTNSLLIREADMSSQLGQKKNLDFKFMNFGGYLGAIGGMIPHGHITDQQQSGH